MNYDLGMFDDEATARTAVETETAALRDGTSIFLNKALLTTIQYAARVGLRAGTVKRWIHEGMPVHRAYRVTRIDPTEADAWVREHRSDSISFSRESVIYVVRRDTDRAIKIGWTSDFPRRLHELMKESKASISLLAAFPGDKPDELRLHERFAADRIEGEWFRESEAVHAFVASLAGFVRGPSEAA